MLGAVIVIVTLIVMHIGVVRGKDYLLVMGSLFLINRLFFLVPLEESHIQDIGKSSDIGLLVPLLYVVAVKRYRSEVHALLATPLGIVIGSLAVMVLVAAILTVVRYGGSLILALRVGRDYTFFLLFFPYAIALKEISNLRRFTKLFLIIFTAIALGYVAQSFLPLNSVFYPSYSEEHLFAGFTVNRIYLNYLEFYCGPVILSSLLAAALCPEHRGMSIMLFVIFVAQAILTLHRVLWSALGLGAAVCIVVGLRTLLPNERKALKIAAVLGISAMLLVSLTPLMSSITERISEGLLDTPLTGGTITGRTLTSATYLEALAENPVAGVGLLHHESWVLDTDDEMAYFSELGSIGYLFHFGIAGLIWIVSLAVTYFRAARVALHSQVASGLDRAIVLGTFGFFAGTFMVSFANGGLSTPSGIALFALGFTFTIRIGGVLPGEVLK